jgi:hypothetical protein
VVYTPVIPALGRLKLEDREFKASLDCIVRPCLRNQNKQTTTIMGFDIVLSQFSEGHQSLVSTC